MHWILKPDPEPWLHDHPVTFLSLLLRGWYVEIRGDGLFHERRWYNFLRATPDDVHTICWVSDSPCVTLALMGPKRREWGFHTDDGWVFWKDYYKKQREEKA